jgi:dipeptidyl aminopeptidase/acylaminoacyl peptidase
MTPAAGSDTLNCHPQAMEIWDILKWRDIAGSALSRDGNWFAWMESQLEDNAEIFVTNLATDSLYNFNCGMTQSNIISFDNANEFLMFKIFPDKDEQDKLKKQKKPGKNKLALVNLANGQLKAFDNVKAVKKAQEKGDWIAIQFNIPDNREDKEKWTGSDLMLYHLPDSLYLNFGNVAEFAFDKYGRWLAMIIDTENQTGNCVLLRNIKTGEVISLESDQADYSNLNWTEEGEALCFLKAVADEDYEADFVSVVGYKNLHQKAPNKIIFDPEDISNFPENMTVSPHFTPAWKEELDGFFFGIHEIEMTAEARAKLDSAVSEKDQPAEDETPDMVIWHWQDKRLQSQQWVNEKQDKNFSYLAYFDIDENRFHRLASDSIRRYVAAKRGDFSLGFNRDKYYLQYSLEGRNFRDIYVYDLNTGTNHLALEKNRWYFGNSPDNKYFLYYTDGHFYTYDMEKKKRINITEKMPVSFIDVEDDHNVKNPPVPPRGWSEDSQYVLLSDGWDIWKVRRDGRKFTNLTIDGKTKNIRYGRDYRLYPEDEGIDLDKDLYLRIYGEYTKKNGIGKISRGKPGVEKLFFSDHDYRDLKKAEDADIFVYTQEDFDSFHDYYATDEKFTNSKKITNVNPQQADYLWSSGRRIIDYVTEYGDSLQGVLYLPANYEKGKTYPTIVYMYEKLSQRANNYLKPRLAGILNFSYYTSNGYAIFTPDITFKLNDPGVSSVKCITAGLEAAMATGIIDRDRIGIQGHSWGGYQTAFAITQTDIFKAAVAGAPLTNMLSMYSSIYWNTGGANMAIFESSQGRFYGGYWDNLEAYTRNSPVYFADQVKTPLLMLHNDKDGAVDWNQGIEYYNTLRRLGKPVVMLEYKGENHGLRKPENRKDYTLRMKEFFDHYLMDKPVPEWWQSGVPYIELKEHLEKRAELLEPEANVADTTKKEAQ